MFKWLKREKTKPLYLCKGDTLHLKYHGKTVLSSKISRFYKVEELGIFEFEDKFGMKAGIGGVFGESND